MNDFGDLLIAVAAPVEASAILLAFGVSSVPGIWMSTDVIPGVRLLLTGIGKANAAGAIAGELSRGRVSAVLNAGIGGALPGSGLGIGDSVAATSSVFADEGIETPGGFIDCAAMGFPIGPFEGSRVPVDARWLGSLTSEAKRAGGVACVSTCSGTDARADEVVRRTGAIVEAMEGAAVGLAACRAGVPFAEVRVVSNTTGDRTRQIWDVRGSCEVLGRLVVVSSSSWRDLCRV